ncbi:putative regulatory protein, ArsR family [Actinomycetes bacterium]|nr:putative regulatory protein, ArsR family [Actinomycetes bacterium]
MDGVLDRARIFSALGDPRRLEIVDELSMSDRTPNELIQKFEIPSALLAHHLDVLEGAGLIRRIASSADKRKRFVQIVRRNLPIIPQFAIPKSVIFVCRQNSARSQLAEALWRLHIGPNVASAGTTPALDVHPLTRKIAALHQLDVDNASPRRFEPSAIKEQTIITVCDQSYEELKPPFRHFHWSIADPAEANTLDAFEQTINDLGERLRSLVNT